MPHGPSYRAYPRLYLTLRKVSFGVTVGLEGGAESVGLAGDGPPRLATRTASQTSPQAAVRSTPCSTSSRLKASLSSPITTIGGSSPRNATRSLPQTSPLT